MLERTYIPLGSGRLQRELLVVPPKKEPVQSGVLPQQYEQEALNPPVAGLLNPPAGQKIKRVIAELEKRRAELFTIALEATARAQEADQKRAEAEAIARAALEKVHKVEKLFMGADEGAYDDAERRLVFGMLVFANEKEKKKSARKAAKKRIPAEVQLNARRQPAFLEYEVRGRGFRDRFKIMGYGLAAALLLLVAGWLILDAFF
ncbi:MAG TPA: hypothetical protein VFV58_06370 [Blastocatellia bacterium]|jgi:hypothetical protein|nr:hypothetical protein [Blastocatellia bacterium]